MSSICFIARLHAFCLAGGSLWRSGSITMSPGSDSSIRVVQCVVVEMAEAIAVARPLVVIAFVG